MTDPRPLFDIEGIEHGWAYVTIRHGHQVSEFPVSDLTDGLGEFVVAIEQVAGETLSGAECRWEHEPSISSISVRRCGRGQDVELRVGTHDGSARSAESVPEFVTELQAVVDMWDLAFVTLTAFERLRDAYGAEGYAERWGYPFPQARLDAIVGHFKKYERIEAEIRRMSEMPAVLPEVLCHGRTASVEIAAAMGVAHVRVVEALRFLEGLGRFRLEERADGVGVITGSLDPQLQIQVPFICREAWGTGHANDSSR